MEAYTQKTCVISFEFTIQSHLLTDDRKNVYNADTTTVAQKTNGGLHENKKCTLIMLESIFTLKMNP